MAKGSQRALNPPFLLSVGSQSPLLHCHVNYVVEHEKGVWGLKAEKMKGLLKHQDSWGEGGSQGYREAGGAPGRKDVCLEQ